MRQGYQSKRAAQARTSERGNSAAARRLLVGPVFAALAF